MSTTEPAAIEPTVDDLAGAIEQVAQARHDGAVAELRAAQTSPLDRSLQRGNGRKAVPYDPVWDVDDVMRTPALTFHEGQLTELPEFKALEGYGVGLAVDAVKGLRETVASLCEARDTLKGNPVAHPAAQALELDRHFAKLTSAASKRIDAAHSTISNAIKAHEQTLSSTLKDSQYGAEVRAMVRSLPKDERMGVLTTAIAANDHTVVSALLGSPSKALTGLTLSDEMHAAFLKQYHLRRDPDTAKKLALAQKAVETLEAAGASLHANAERILGIRHKTLERLRAQSAKVQKALSFGTGTA